jgi:Ca-activated chloride channel family protein
MNRFLLALLLLVFQSAFKVRVDLVTVGVRVTDSRGRDVRGLKVANFSVFDDDVAQHIEFVSSDQQSIALGLLLDRSSSMSDHAKLGRAKEAASALVRAAREGSEFFFLAFDDQVPPGVDVTTDRQRIESAIEGTTVGGGTSLYDAILHGMSLYSRSQLPRQALIIISDGADQHSAHALQEVIQAVQESETQVYTIGYFSRDEEELFKTPEATLTLIDGQVIDNPRIVLETLAHDSGADAFFPRSDVELSKAVQEIAAALRTQYSIAYYPSALRDNHYHQLRVRILGGRYNVRARPGYRFAP